MQVKNGDVWQAQKAIVALTEERWPVKTAYALARLANQINRQFATIEQVRHKLLQQYGTQEGNQISVAAGSPNHAAFIKDFAELLDIDVEIAGGKVALPDGNDITLAPSVLMPLDPFVEVA